MININEFITDKQLVEGLQKEIEKLHYVISSEDARFKQELEKKNITMLKLKEINDELNLKLKQQTNNLKDVFKGKKIEASKQLKDKKQDIQNMQNELNEKSLSYEKLHNIIHKLKQDLLITDHSNKKLFEKIKVLTNEIDSLKGQLVKKEDEIREREAYYPLLMEMQKIQLEQEYKDIIYQNTRKEIEKKISH